MDKQPLTKKGLLLGIVLLAMAVLSTVLIFSLRPKAEEPQETAAEKTLP